MIFHASFLRTLRKPPGAPANTTNTLNIRLAVDAIQQEETAAPGRRVLPRGPVEAVNPVRELDRHALLRRRVLADLEVILTWTRG